MHRSATSCAHRLAPARTRTTRSYRGRVHGGRLPSSTGRDGPVLWHTDAVWGPSTPSVIRIVRRWRSCFLHTLRLADNGVCADERVRALVSPRAGGLCAVTRQRSRGVSVGIVEGDGGRAGAQFDHQEGETRMSSILRSPLKDYGRKGEFANQ